MSEIRSRTPTPSIGVGSAPLTSVTASEQEKPLLGQVKGKYTSQDDLLFEAQEKAKERSTKVRPKWDDTSDLTFSEQWKVFKVYLYDEKSARFLGRSLFDWSFLVLFYFLFFVTLSATLAIGLSIFYTQVSVITPRLHNERSIMRDYDNAIPSPGMGIRPLPDFETTLITFQANKPETYKFYTDHVQSFLKSYQTVYARDDIRRKDCKENNLPDKEIGCMFQPEKNLGDCGKIDAQAALGYDDGVPCVILKLNKIYGWVPQPIVCRLSSGDNKTVTCDGLTPSEMQWFREVGRPGVPLQELFNGQKIPVTCEGRNSPDQENILNIRWEPKELHGSFPAYFYPYFNQRGYLAPLVGAQFNVSRAVLIMIRCKAWAKNIRNSNVASRDGAIHFELMVD